MDLPLCSDIQFMGPLQAHTFLARSMTQKNGNKKLNPHAPLWSLQNTAFFSFWYCLYSPLASNHSDCSNGAKNGQFWKQRWLSENVSNLKIFIHVNCVIFTCLIKSNQTLKATKLVIMCHHLMIDISPPVILWHVCGTLGVTAERGVG